jgi:hypothetical protein
VTLLRRPRLYVWAAAVVAFLVAAWLLLVPITVVYLVSTEQPDPYRDSHLYSWWTRDQNLVFSDTGMSGGKHLVQGIRLNCGTPFTTGEYEQSQTPAGPRACAQVEAPRRAIGLCLVAVAAVAAVATRWRRTRSTDQDRYRMPYAQRRALRRTR